jgi:hypothetical protein
LVLVCLFALILTLLPTAALAASDTTPAIDGVRGIIIPLGGAADASVATSAAPTITTSDFGPQEVGPTGQLGYRLTALSTSSSTGKLYFTGFAITGPNASDFTQTNNCPGPPGLEVGQSCVYIVSFTPTARGPRSATLTISCNGNNCPLIENLVGSGTMPCGQLFGDVKANNPACEAIEGLADRGVIKGCDQAASPPLFCPTEPTLRAQMAALIARAVGWDAEDHNNTFPDRCLPNNGGCIDDALWRNIGTLQFYGVAKGFQDGTYNPFDNVLYAQTISFITRAMVKKGTWTQATVDDSSVYPNIPASSGHRLDFVTYVKYVGPVPGTTTATQNFDQWNQPSTRTWFAQALWQALPDSR